MRKDPRVVGVIAGSPPMISAGRIDPELLAQAERLVADGRGQDLLPWGSTHAGANTQSAQMIVNRARVGLGVYASI